VFPVVEELGHDRAEQQLIIAAGAETRARHIEALGDLRAGHPQPPQRGDHFDAAVIGAVRDRPGC
jgi:hypothetical protein